MSINASTRTARWFLVLTFVASAILYLCGNGRVSLWDRDEPRYAQCSRQMIDGFAGPGGHGPDWIVPRFLEDLRTEKPPLIYWLQAGSMKLFGENSFAARFPSSVSMIGVLILMGIVLCQAVGSITAAWAVFIMASSALTILSAKMCLTDAFLLLCTTTAQLCAYAVYRGNRSWKITLTFWIALGIGGLTKGPIVLTTLGATFVALAILDYFIDRKVNVKWWLALRPWIGVVIIAAIVGPWMWAVHRREPDFLPRIFGMAYKHLTSAQEKHFGPPGFYLTLIFGLFFPWCLLLPPTLTIAWKNRRYPGVRYCWAIILGVWIFQELMKTKLPFYILPIFPALALLTADAIVSCIRGEHSDIARTIFVKAVAVFALAVLVIGTLPWLLFGHLPEKLFHSSLDIGSLGSKPATIGFSVLAVIYAVTVFYLFQRRRIAAGAIAMGIGAMTMFAFLYNCYLPDAQYLNTSRRVAELLQNQTILPGDGIMIEYKEPSLAFYSGGRLREQAATHFLEKTPSDRWPTWIILPKSLWDATPKNIQDQLQPIGQPVRGVNYAGKIDGRKAIEVMVLKKRSSGPATSESSNP